MPLVKALGYDYMGKYKITRSRALKSQFIMNGVNKKKINIYPDYILGCDGKCVCVIDAKKPSESLEHEENISQVYSYAVHREIKSDYFALCNGREFRLYSIFSLNPIMVFQMKYLKSHFEKLNTLIGANNVLVHLEKGKEKDLGIHLKMLERGNIEQKYIFMDIPVRCITLVEPNTYTIDAAIMIPGEKYCASFDFDFTTLLELENVVINEVFDKLKEPFCGIPIRVSFVDNIINVGIECKLGKKIYENTDEQYLPLRICHFQYANLI